MKYRGPALWLLLAAVSACGTASDPAVQPRGNADAGRELIARLGCGACHIIPGIRSADGLVGPPLTAWSRRVYLAGRYPNTAENLVAWLLDPARHAPATAMPDLGLTREQAGDIAAYLYELE
jgi:cytochrome c